MANDHSKRSLDTIGSSLFEKKSSQQLIDEFEQDKKSLDTIGSSLLDKKSLDHVGSSLIDKRSRESAGANDALGMRKRSLDSIGSSIFEKRAAAAAYDDDVYNRAIFGDEAMERRSLDTIGSALIDEEKRGGAGGFRERDDGMYDFGMAPPMYDNDEAFPVAAEKRHFDSIGSGLVRKRMFDRIGSGLVRKRWLDSVGSGLIKRTNQNALAASKVREYDTAKPQFERQLNLWDDPDVRYNKGKRRG